MLGRRLLAGLMGATVLWPVAAAAQSEDDCYDARVSAVIVQQVPTIMPDLGDGSIVIRWPWIIDLEVRSVLEGEAPLGAVTVLTVQHNYFRRDLGERLWALRRNDLGVFNVVGMGEDIENPRCDPDLPAAQPFIRPGRDSTLDSLRREGLEYYGDLD